MVWIFCPEMTLAQIPEIGFFVQNSRIGVKILFRSIRSRGNSIFIIIDKPIRRRSPVHLMWSTPRDSKDQITPMRTHILSK